MNTQRGEALLGALAIASLIGLAWAMLGPAVGRYAIASDGAGGMIVIDTATKQAERCKIIAGALDCKPLETAGR